MKVLAAALGALMLVACGGQNGNNSNAAGAGGAAGGQGARSLQPGQWEMTSQMASIEIPGAPPQALAQMRAQQGRTQTDRTCITSEQASNPLRQLREGMAGPGAGCQTSEDVFANGVIRIRTTCRAPGGAQGTVQLAVEGTFTATTLTGTVSINAEGANVAGPGTRSMRVSTNLTGRRVGDCPANAQPRAAQPGNGQ